MLLKHRELLWLIILALDIVLFIAALDQTIVAYGIYLHTLTRSRTSIPTITKGLRSATGYTWIGGAYLMASATAGPLWTKGSDIWGRKPALLGAVCMFAGGSLTAALATDMNMLIAARALQGLACGGIFQLVSVSTSDLFSLRERALFFGLQGGVYAIAGSAGPLPGGAFSQYLSWRYCFWINLPVCGVSFVLLVFLLDTHNPRTPLLAGQKAVDWAGTLSMLSASLLLLLGLNFGGALFAWNSTAVICLLVVGSVMIGVFLFSEKRLARYPLMPLSVFTTLSSSAVVLVAVGHSMVAIGIEYYLPLYFQSVKQESPFISGLLLLPYTITAATTDIICGIVIHKTARYIELIWIGVLLMTLGTGLFITLWSSTPLSHIIGFEIIIGVGIALLFQAPVLVIHNTVRQAEVAAATATLGFFRSLATAVSVGAGGGAVFQNSMDDRQSLLVSANLNQTGVELFSGQYATASIDMIQNITDPAQKGVVIDAYAWSVRNIFIFHVCVAGTAAVLGLCVKQGHMSSEHAETKTGIEHMVERRAVDED